MSLAPGPGDKLTMICQNLETTPVFTLPAGFQLRWYVPGDEKLWLEIHLQADPYNPITSQFFQQQFGNDSAELAKRQCYLVAPDGRAIGTATAWFGKDPLVREFGRVHWVALLPEYHGRGLSKPLLGAICACLRELGHSRAYLNTSAQRKAAIGLYLRFGFKPWIGNEHERNIWDQLLGSPYDFVSNLG